MTTPEDPGDAKSSSACRCVQDIFAALPPGERPHGKPPMGNLCHVTCPVCGLEYWTNRTANICRECEKGTN